MNELKNEKMIRDCTISSLVFAILTFIFTMTAGVLAAIYDCYNSAILASTALPLCFITIVLSAVALSKHNFNGEDTNNVKIKKLLITMVVLSVIIFMFLLISLIIGYLEEKFRYDIVYYRGDYYFYNSSWGWTVCVATCAFFSFAAMSASIAIIALSSEVISLENKIIKPQIKSTSGSAYSAVESLQDYKYLYENGLITQEEYDTQRERILSQLGL